MRPSVQGEEARVNCHARATRSTVRRLKGRRVMHPCSWPTLATVIALLIARTAGADPRLVVANALAPTSPHSQEPPLVAPSLARACVAAALRASGLGTSDASIDALVGRSRTSAWLPDAHLRAMRLIAEGAHETTLATTDGTNYYQTVGSHLVLELSLTWRLDRLLYAGDEPTVERLRLERLEARTRLTSKTLEALFSWQRALLDADEALSGSDQELQARGRAAEARATLDVLTGGWFSRRGESP
jgi:hypothetical protein